MKYSEAILDQVNGLKKHLNFCSQNLLIIDHIFSHLYGFSWKMSKIWLLQNTKWLYSTRLGSVIGRLGSSWIFKKLIWLGSTQAEIFEARLELKKSWLDPPLTWLISRFADSLIAIWQYEHFRIWSLLRFTLELW